MAIVAVALTGLVPAAAAADDRRGPAAYWMLDATGHVYAFWRRPLVRRQRATPSPPTSSPRPTARGTGSCTSTARSARPANATNLGTVPPPETPGEFAVSIGRTPERPGLLDHDPRPAGCSPSATPSTSATWRARRGLKRPHPERPAHGVRQGLLAGGLPTAGSSRSATPCSTGAWGGTELNAPVRALVADAEGRGLLVGRHRRRRVRLRRRHVPRVHGRHALEPADPGDGPLGRRLPHGRRGRRHLRLLGLRLSSARSATNPPAAPIVAVAAYPARH